MPASHHFSLPITFSSFEQEKFQLLRNHLYYMLDTFSVLHGRRLPTSKYYPPAYQTLSSPTINHYRSPVLPISMVILVVSLLCRNYVDMPSHIGHVCACQNRKRSLRPIDHRFEKNRQLGTFLALLRASFKFFYYLWSYNI